jgi:hypothetical protein
MAVHKILRTYRFIDKDPVIDELRTLVQDEGLYGRLGVVAELANLAPSTLHNLFHGETRQPRNSTVMGIATSLGYLRTWAKATKLNDIEDELKLARAWNKRERKRQELEREKEKPRKKKAS